MRTPRALPPVKAPKRAVEPRLALALRVLLEGRHRGRANGATWEQLRDELIAEEHEVGNVRRLQECAQHLRRVDKVPIGATSQAGVFLIVDAEDKKIAALDVSLYERIAGFLAKVLPDEDAVEEAMRSLAAVAPAPPPPAPVAPPPANMPAFPPTQLGLLGGLR
jgi:hypothetical protein